MPDPVTVLAQLGGHAPTSRLVERVGRASVRAALASGEIARVRPRHVALSGLDGAQLAAARVNGALSHSSALLAVGIPVLDPPPRPHVTVDRSRKIAPDRRHGMRLRWGSVSGAEAAVLPPTIAAVGCAVALPFPDALAAADGVLRAGVDRSDLEAAARVWPRTGRSRALEVVRLASPLAANPFESALRALSIEAVGERFRPQVTVSVGGHRFRPDLVDPELRIVAEADSHEFHTSKAAIVRDCHRYDELTLGGWTVLRFAWLHVMRDQEWCRDVLRRAVRRASGS